MPLDGLFRCDKFQDLSQIVTIIMSCHSIVNSEHFLKRTKNIFGGITFEDSYLKNKIFCLEQFFNEILQMFKAVRKKMRYGKITD